MNLPDYICNYAVTPSSPTEELLTLARLLSEVGDYASTILQPAYQRFHQECETKLRPVLVELTKRNIIKRIEDIFVPSRKAPLYLRYETVREWQSLNPASFAARLQKDYLLMTFANDLEYEAFLIRKPIGDPADYTVLDRTRTYTSAELLKAIKKYSAYRSVYQKMMLDQYVDLAKEKTPRQS